MTQLIDKSFQLVHFRNDMSQNESQVIKEQSTPNGNIVALIIVLSLPVLYFLGSVTASIISQYVTGTDLENFFLRKGDGKLIRRTTMLWVLPFIPLLFKSLQWQGRADTGWIDPLAADNKKAALKRIGLGFVVGILTLGCAAVLMNLFDCRISKDRTNGEILFRIFKALSSGIAVALLEETLLRGMIFRSLARIWSAWPAALYISLLTALLHFMMPARETFIYDSHWANGLEGVRTWAASLMQTDYLWIRCLNITLMGLVLSATVILTRSIWLGVGLHAGWVWVKSMNGYIGKGNHEKEYSMWIGQRSDATDSFLCSFLLMAVLIGVMLFTKKDSQRNSISDSTDGTI